ncbi:hypothetical protein IMG5_058980 [Ichthyophthirius multifiliis]|uniref:Piezo non-specific cation channel cap domain-containing protein n=1 Tax=Ichthyophthirius multifiliis TaxID=5932 RepID=G0QNI8_ICHMU|nr:hypothetical protein IMG5_058980 [Ichthyophthirius multifiliis]EGR33222.1 hypothetical protein IMG5_058980 [Ichthyophthirius multifiliis]|eukprot:XP_004037208.1 hypothetical protein IMG5_058980 [Ichthyophthirius multifiliis]
MANAHFEIGIQFNGIKGSYYSLYKNNNIANLTNVPVSKRGKFIEFSQILESEEAQFQQFQLYAYSDSNWDASIPIKKQITDMLNNAVQQNQPIQIQFKVTYQIIRTLDKTLKDCNGEGIYLPNFHISLLRLLTIGNTYLAKPFDNLSAEQQQKYTKDAHLNLKCKLDNESQKFDNNIQYWILTESKQEYKNKNHDEFNDGIKFYILSDKYSSALLGFSIITIYTSVILVIGKVIKSVFSGNIDMLMYSEQPFPDKLIKVCEAIGYSRTKRDLIKENLLYYELIDLLRSPEIIKMLTGSYSKMIKDQRKKWLENEENLEILRLKKKQQ